MKKLEIKAFAGSITEQDINDFCEQYKIELPPDYVKFMLKYNGGSSNYRTFKYEMDGDVHEDNIEYFIPLKSERSDNVLSSYREPMMLSRIPEWLFVIGENGSGDCICIAISGKQKGKLFFWIHDLETEDEYGNPSCDNIFQIKAKDFSDFLKNLGGEEIKYREDDPLYKFIKDASCEDVQKRIKDDPDFIYYKNEFADRPIKLAIRHFRNDLFDLLYFENEKISSGTWLYCASINNNVEIMERLIKEKSADINEKDSMGVSCAMVAAEYGCIEALKTLIKFGVDLDALEDRKFNIADYVKRFCHENKDEVIKILADAKKDDPLFLKKLGVV